jgi:hypothetical protein
MRKPTLAILASVVAACGAPAPRTSDAAAAGLSSTSGISAKTDA